MTGPRERRSAGMNEITEPSTVPATWEAVVQAARGPHVRAQLTTVPVLEFFGPDPALLNRAAAMALREAQRNGSFLVCVGQMIQPTGDGYALKVFLLLDEPDED